MIRMLAVASALLLVSAGCAETKGLAGEAPRIAPERIDKIRKALAGKDWYMVRRALLEAAQVGQPDPQLVKAVLSSEVARSMPLDSVTLRVLGEAGGEAAEEVIRIYGGDLDKNADLLPLLGRMGKNAIGAVPSLRKRLAAPGVKPEEQTTIKVVLACMGQATTAEMGEIADALNKKGSRSAVIKSMFYIGRNEWVNDAIKDSLIGAVGRNEDKQGQVFAIFALVTLGGKTDRAVVNGLARVYLDIEKRDAGVLGPDTSYDEGLDPQGDLLMIWSGLALAAVDPQHRPVAMRAAFLANYHVNLGEWLTREMFNFPDLFCSAACNAALVKEAVSLVSDKDPRVARSAARFLQVVGPPATAATPHLVRLVESAGDEDLRKAAADALAMVADPSDLPKLRELAKKCDDETKEVLEASIRVINLGE